MQELYQTGLEWRRGSLLLLPRNKPNGRFLLYCSIRLLYRAWFPLNDLTFCTAGSLPRFQYQTHIKWREAYSGHSSW
jgi:hypothetical protein